MHKFQDPQRVRRNLMAGVSVMALAATALLGGAASAAAAVDTSGPCDSVPDNLVVNCGFENGADPSPWSTSGDIQYTGTYNSPGDAHSGGWVDYFGNTDHVDTTLSQSVTVTPGGTYDLAYWVSNNGTGSNHFSATVDGTDGGPQTLNDLTDSDPFAMTEYTDTVTAGDSGTITVAFNGYNEPGQYFLDDVSLVRSFAAQAIVFTSSPPAPARFGDNSYVVTATGGGSNNPVALSADPSSTGVCTVTDNGDSSAAVDLTGVGTCTINAHQDGDVTYDPTDAQQAFTVYKALQAISFTSTPPTHATPGSNYTVSATGGASGNQVTFTTQPSDAGICSISDNGDSSAMVSFTGNGVCTIAAHQAGNADYMGAPIARQHVTVRTDQAITFTSTPGHVVVGDIYQASATGGGSTNMVKFGATQADNGICTVGTDGTVTAIGTGSCSVVARQNGNASYYAAPAKQQHFRIYAA